MSNDLKDPKTLYKTPPHDEDLQSEPGVTTEMNIKPDHGEKSYVGSGKLTDKRIIITGGDSGIGRAVAIAYAREGADIVLSYLEEDDDAKETAKYIKEAGRKAVLIKGDISEEQHCKHIIETAVDQLGGRIDVLVNNAAFQMARESLQDIPSEEWEYTFKTNIHSMFYLCKMAEPYMQPGSSIINTTSVNAYNPTPVLLAYAATKGAIQNFTANLAQILGDKGIRVNCVAPGPIWTPLIPATMPKEKVENFGKNTPLERLGQPAELAAVYVLLASAEGSYINGATIPVTGGRITI
ncbi:SDR family oxidoreductase [Fulvivirga maritima]|uniref:SDR family oxidoreductase n=1 Tax=Fulvivirga maritima TaxID=2904247 RepID=UPI001F4611A9|nr:SDR family oxidoreductase [Fulvivirga maritima]UII25789.1 SDR family oxidoreductase [Fulvivirga maritima]